MAVFHCFCVVSVDESSLFFTVVFFSIRNASIYLFFRSPVVNIAFTAFVEHMKEKGIHQKCTYIFHTCIHLSRDYIKTLPHTTTYANASSNSSLSIFLRWSVFSLTVLLTHNFSCWSSSPSSNCMCYAMFNVSFIYYLFFIIFSMCLFGVTCLLKLFFLFTFCCLLFSPLPVFYTFSIFDGASVFPYIRERPSSPLARCTTCSCFMYIIYCAYQNIYKKE